MQMLNISVTAVNFFALFCLFGAIISRFFVFPAGVFAVQSILKAWKLFFVISLSLLTLSTFTLFILNSLDMGNGEFNTLYDLFFTLIIQTNFGHMMVICLLSILCAWAVLITIKSNERFSLAYCFLFLIFLVIAFTSSSISHAGDSGNFTLKEMVDWLHIVSAASWAGSIITVVVCCFTSFAALSKQPVLLLQLLTRLSLVSAISLLLIVCSGIYNAYWLLGSFSALATSSAGNILAIKLPAYAVD